MIRNVFPDNCFFLKSAMYGTGMMCLSWSQVHQILSHRLKLFVELTEQTPMTFHLSNVASQLLDNTISL